MGQMFKAVGAHAKQWASKDELQTIVDELWISVEHTKSDEGETTVGDKDAEPELIVNHGYTEEDDVRAIQFRLEWKGSEDPSDQTWHQMKDLKNCQRLVEDYMLSEELEPDGLINQHVASVEDGAPVEADDDVFDEEHIEFLPTPQADGKREPEAPAYRFGHLIDYDLTNRVKSKVEKLTKEFVA